MGLKTEQLENRNGWRNGRGKKWDKNQLNRFIRRRSKDLDKKVYDFESWSDQDEEGNFSIEADYQYPTNKQFKGWEY